MSDHSVTAVIGLVTCGVVVWFVVHSVLTAIGLPIVVLALGLGGGFLLRKLDAK